MHTEGLIKLTVMRMHNTGLYNSGYIISPFFQRGSITLNLLYNTKYECSKYNVPKMF